MTIKTTKFGGNDFESGTALPSADLNDTFRETKKDFKIVYGAIQEAMCIVGHNSTDVSYVEGGDAIFNTTNYKSSNITWTSKNTNVVANTGILMFNCKADREVAIAMEVTGADSAFTSNAGVTWGDTSTNPPNATSIHDLSFPTTTLAIAVGDNSGAGADIWISTDGGDNWAEVTAEAGTALVLAVDMLDGTTGFAVDNDENILKTTDSGANWTDTGIDSPIAGSISHTAIYTIDANTYLVSQGGYIYKGTDSVQATIVYSHGQGLSSNFVKTANGNIYIVFVLNDASGDSSVIIMAKSTDDGATWTDTILGVGARFDTNTQNFKSILSEAGDNELIFVPRPAKDVLSKIIAINEN